MDYKNHPLNNTFILSKGGEHGKQVIKFWQDQGVNTGTLNGNEKGSYYGLNNGEFSAYFDLPKKGKEYKLSEYELYAVYNNDKVNSILAIALRTLDHKELIALKDALVEKTPQYKNF